MNIQPQPTREKIMDILKRRGPSIPIHIANEIGMTTLFSSAFLGELLSSKEIKMSNMKVGGTPIYFIEGQEPQLETYSQFLKNKEKEAFLLLKEKKFLEDNNQEPAIRVALRAIKDFAIPFENNGKNLWRFFTIPVSEYNPPEEKILSEEKKEIIEIKKEIIEIPSKENQETTNQEEIIPTSSGNLNFLDNVLKAINQNKIKLLEKTELKKREFLGIGRIETNLGEIEVLLIAKDKKSITQKDLEKVTKKIKEIQKTAVFFSNGKLDKKAKEFYREVKNIIYFKEISESF